MYTRVNAVWSIGVLLGFMLSGCENREESHTPAGPEGTAPAAATGVMRLKVMFAPWQRGAAKVAGIAAIDRVTAYVYSSGGTKLKQEDMTIDGETYSGRITVEALDNLRVVLGFFDGAIVRWLGEDSDVDVPAGGEETAVIVEEYMGTSVTAPATADVGQVYTVSWTERPLATGYELEEAMQSDFSDAAMVPSVVGTSHEIAGKPQSGVTYYYRARTTTEYGNGPWHSTGDASTGIEAEQGTIIIEGGLPPDEPSGELTVTLPGGATMEMVWIEAGTFLMGSPDTETGRGSDEGPQHEVTISQGFYLGKYEITQGQWEVVMASTPWSGEDYVMENPEHPAVNISWDDTQQLIQELNDAAGEDIYRLPTEAEWEYACRAGTTTRWSFGDDEGQLGDYAWYAANAWEAGLQYAQPVGTKLPNPWGLYDIHGNVFEWCHDWYGAYTVDSQIDPPGPATGSRRVIRGDSFGASAKTVRSAYRNNYLPSDRGYWSGARLLRIR